MGRVQKLVNLECNTSLSELFRINMILINFFQTAASNGNTF
jgi:hypothetical protein